MNFVVDFLTNFWHLATMIGLYVFIGLIFVGIVHLYISEEWIKKHLGEKSRFGALKGALYGIPLPLCSCGVIPLAASLRKKGASKSSITSFFITTPMTGVDSIIATYGVFGLPMAILRVISSFISGLIAGILVKEEPNSLQEEEKSSCCSGGGCCGTKEKTDERNGFQKALDYALNEVFADIVKPMFYGLLLAVGFMMFIPQNGIEFLNDQLFLAYLLVFLISLPMYVCSISAIPIALSMLTVGISPGVAFIFLAAAPATNLITAGVVKKVLGNNALIVYLLSIVIVTLSFALLIDFTLPKEWFQMTNMVNLSEEGSLLEDIFGGVFLVLMGFYLVKSYRKK